MHPGDPRQAGNQPPVYPFKIIMIPADNPQDIIRLPSHQMTLKNLRHILHGGLECIQRGLTLT